MRHLRRAVFVLLAVLWLTGVAHAQDGASYSMTQNIPVPPATSYSGGGGGDGWAVALTPTSVYNVFHHASRLTVACHKQADASSCWSPKTIVDAAGGQFATPGHPGLYLDQASAKLYVYATRVADSSPGVVCVDLAKADQGSDPFCGYTLLGNAGDAPVSSNSALSTSSLVGTHLYAFNYADGAGVSRSKNTLLCFDTALKAPCAGQPFTLPITAGTVADGAFPVPAAVAVAGRMIVPITVGGVDQLTCFDDATAGTCAGTWPRTLATRYSTTAGALFPLLSESGAITGFCLPVSGDPCFDFTGQSVSTPQGMSAAITPSSGWNGGAFVLGTRVYVPNGSIDRVQCFNAATGASCVNFPKSFSGLGSLYTVNPDPQRPSCIWVNADNGSGQIQNFDAYTGGGCGQGPVRVLAASVVAPNPACAPTSYSSLQVLAPPRTGYTNGTITFVDGDNQAIPGVPVKTLDATGSVSLSGLPLNTNHGLPQFLITLEGAAATTSVSVKITWTAAADPSCTPTGQQASLVYVAVGDSYSSGEGAKPFEDGKNYPYVDAQENTLTYGPGATGCHRSLTNWAKIAAPRLSQTLIPALIDRTCSGAQIVPGSAGGQGPIAPTPATSGRSDGQVDQALTRLAKDGRDADAVQLVSATMGGNDAGFGDLIQACLMPTIARTLFTNYEQTPGEVEWFVSRFHCQDVDERFFKTGDKIKKLQALEEDAQAGLLDAFPNARVTQLTYPGIVPDADDFTGDSCGGLLSTDAAYVRSKVQAIDDAVRKAGTATRKTSARMRVVDVQSAFGSNPLCPADPSKALANGISQERLTAVVKSLLAESTESRRLLDELNGRYQGFRNCVTTHAIGGVLGPLGAVGAEVLCKGPLDNLMDAYHALADYFDGARVKELVGQLADGATSDQRFDNSRRFFHPTTPGYDVMGCYLAADFKATGTGDCKPKYDGVLAYSVNGVALVHPTPIAVRPSLSLPFFLNGFDLGSLLDVIIHSPAQGLGSFPVAPDGSVSNSLTLPSDLAAGVHKLTFSGTNNGSPRHVDVLAQVPGLPQAGQDYGIYQPGFAGDEAVTAKLGDLDWGTLRPDGEGGVFTEVPVPQLQPGEVLPLTLTGSTGQAIRVSVTLAAQPGSPPSTPPAAPLACTLNPVLSISPATLVAGRSAQVTVRAVPGSTVTLTTGSKATVKADARGEARLTIKLQKNTRLSARVAASGCATVNSAVRTVSVRPAVTLRIHNAGAHRYTLSGSVKPATGKVRLYATDSAGHRKLIAHTKVNRKTGRWSVTRTFAKGKRVTVVAKVDRTKTNAAGTSPKRRIG